MLTSGRPIDKDECVTVKSPASNILVESVYCNWSGGCAIGSLGADTAISNIEYNNVYSQSCNQMFMIKSNGGSGYLENSVFKNFMGHSNAYTLDLDSAWSSQTTAAGSGVEYTNLTFSEWHGTSSNGAQRPVIRLICQAGVPCKELEVTEFHVWTDSGKSVDYLCENAYGSGYCLKSGSNYAAYTTTSTVTTVASSAYTTMPGEVTAGLGLTVSIAIPPVPTSFYPGLEPSKALCKSGGC